MRKDLRIIQLRDLSGFLGDGASYCELAGAPKAFNDAEVVEGHGRKQDFGGIEVT